MCNFFRRFAEPRARTTGIVLLTLALLCAGLGALVYPSGRAASPFVREDILVPVAEAHYMLAVTIVRPSGAGPFGAVVLNHGVGNDAQSRYAESPSLLI